jgi:hypothetical protein
MVMPDLSESENWQFCEMVKPRVSEPAWEFIYKKKRVACQEKWGHIPRGDRVTND